MVKQGGKRYRTYTSPKAQKRDTEISQEVQKKLLRTQINVLKRLPNDFRLLEPGTVKWQLFHKLMPERRTDMDAWANGPVLYFQSLAPLEEQVLGKERLIHYKIENPGLQTETINWMLLQGLMAMAVAHSVSFIYIKGKSAETIVSCMNKLANLWHWSFRFKKTLMSTMDKEATLEMKLPV